MKLKKAIANTLNEFIESSGLTAREIAKRCDLAEETVSRLRHEKHKARVETLLKFRAVGLDILQEI